jgi:hypothetical protein
MIVAAVSPGPTLQLGERRVLFRWRGDHLYLTERESYTPLDVGRDGQRFIMARRRRTEGASAAPLIVVENWFEEVRPRTRR